jgi:protein-S-isoprenylcysteine O-methyltransferase Ste14
VSNSVAPIYYASLVAIWVAYGLIHSLLAANITKSWAARKIPALAHRYRLLFNLIAVVTLLPPALLNHALASEPLWAWQGVGAWFANGLALAALAGFWHSSRGYDMVGFMGLRSGGDQPAKFVISDWHRHVRHPWYFFALIIIWTRNMDLATLISATAMSAYFVIGTWFEERKLIAEFGQKYRDYRARVPAILPLPGRTLSRAEAVALTST